MQVIKDYNELNENKKILYRKIFYLLAKFLKKNIKSLFSLWEDLGLHIIPNHFYEPIPDTRFFNDDRTKIFNINYLAFEDKKFLNFLNIIKKYNIEFIEYLKKNKSNFYFGNGLYDSIDAIVLFSIIREIKPKKVIEIGSGFSTEIISIAGKLNGKINIICIDPYSTIDISSTYGVKEIIKKPVEKIDLELFYSLTDNDIFFIDSSHTVKTGSDVVFLILEVLPFLKKNVFIHFHDIFLPLDYPIYWIKKEKRFWNEQYLLQAFLSFNKQFEIFFPTSYMGLKYYNLMKDTFIFPEQLKQELEIIFRKFFPQINWWGGGSFWIKSNIIEK